MSEIDPKSTLDSRLIQSGGESSLTIPQESVKIPTSYMLILIVLSMSEGYTLGYMNSLLSIFRQKQVPSKELGMITLVLYPIVLAFIGAPIVDRFFSSKLGKRKTYILPCKIIQASGYFALSFFIDAAVDRSDVYFIAYCLLAIGMVQFFEYNALAGLRYELYGTKGAGTVSFTIAVGLLIGVFISSQLFTILNTDVVCKFVLHSDCTYILNHRQICIVYSITSIVGFFGCMRIQEKHEEAKGRKLVSNWQFIKIFFKDRLHRRALVWMIFSCAGISAIKDLASLQMLDKGYGRQNSVIISTATMPINLFCTYLLKRFLTPGRILKVCSYLIVQHLILNMISVYPMVYYRGPEDEKMANIFTVIMSISDCLCPWIPCYFALVASIVHKKYAATFYATMQGIVNLGKTIPVSVSLSLLDYVNIVIFYFTIQIINLAFIGFTYRTYIKEIDNTPSEVFNKMVDKYIDTDKQNGEK